LYLTRYLICVLTFIYLYICKKGITKVFFFENEDKVDHVTGCKAVTVQICKRNTLGHGKATKNMQKKSNCCHLNNKW